MKFPTISRIARERNSPAFAAALLAMTFATGCASPGPPRPPSLHLPKVVTDLTAQRIGNEVQLHWTTPAKTTDDLSINGKITAEICREAVQKSLLQPAARQPDCIAIKRLIPHPGPSDATDVLPQALTSGPVSLVAYRITILNGNGRSAGLSPKAFTLAGLAPAPVEQLRATPARSGVQLEWLKENSAFPIVLDRTRVSMPAHPKTESKRSNSGHITSSEPAEVQLQAGSQTSDSGGTIDRTAQRGDTYQYAAQRIRKLVLAGHALEMRSAPSTPITVYMRDTFPPATPTGIAAIPGGNTLANRSIDLSWEPVPDLDIAGYIIYRQQVTPDGSPTEPPTRLTPAPIAGPAFSDHTAVPGRRYAYRVTAIDTSGNESAPSAAIQEVLPEP
jgi:hypothetical protein